MRSTNFDVAAEWYIDRSSSITATLFHRSVAGFIQSVTSNVQIDYLGPDNGTYQVVSPQNSGSGKLTGVEGGFTYFPRFLDGFGVSANGTYLDGVNRAFSLLPGRTGFLGIPFENVSKFSATATLIYEKHGLSTRASYVWRDSCNAGLHFTGVNPNGITNGAINNLPSTMLCGTAAAAGIAIINSVGNLGPFLVGFIKQRTGSAAGGLYVLAAWLAITVIVLARDGRAARGTA